MLDLCLVCERNEEVDGEEALAERSLAGDHASDHGRGHVDLLRLLVLARDVLKEPLQTRTCTYWLSSGVHALLVASVERLKALP